MKSSKRLHYSTLVRVARSILFVAVVVALALVVVDVYQQRTGERVLRAPGTERTAPTPRGHLVQGLV